MPRKIKKPAVQIVLGYYCPEGESAVGLLPMVRSASAPLGLPIGPFVRPTDSRFRLLLAAGLPTVPLYRCARPAPELLDY